MQLVNLEFLALKTAFGSLYRDYVFMKPVEVIGVLAAAFLLQLVCILNYHCTMYSIVPCIISGELFFLVYDTLTITVIIGHEAWWIFLLIFFPLSSSWNCFFTKRRQIQNRCTGCAPSCVKIFLYLFWKFWLYNVHFL